MIRRNLGEYSKMKYHQTIFTFLLILTINICEGCDAPKYSAKPSIKNLPASTNIKAGQVLHWIKNVQTITKDDIKLLRRHLLRHGAVVIKRQNLTHDEQLNFTKILGEPIPIPSSFFMTGGDNTKMMTVVPVSNYWNNGSWKGGLYAYGGYWHKDVNFLPEKDAYVLSILYAKEYNQGENGGKTGFINACKARRELPRPLDESLRNVRFKFGPALITDYPRARKQDLDLYPEVERNIIFTHPERKCECLNMAKTKYGFMLNNMTDSTVKAAETAWEWVQNQSIYEHTWTEGDIVIWDNFSVFHKLIPYTDIGKKRIFYRTYTRITPEI